MKTTHLLYSLIVAALVISSAIVSTGCSGSKNSSSKPELSDSAKTALRDQALERYLNGQTLDQKEDFASAILEYQDALRFFEDASIYSALSKDYAKIGKIDQAIEAAKNTIRLEPENVTFRQNLADLYAENRRFDDALLEYQEIIKKDSSQQDAWRNYAAIMQLKDPLKSLELCQQIIDRFGPDESIYIQLIQSYDMLGKDDKVAEAMQGYLTLDPTNVELKKSLGDVYMKMDSVDTALKIYNELVELQPSNVVIRASVAHAYLDKHDYAKAREQFDVLMTKDTLSIDEQLEFGKVFITYVERDSSVVPIAMELFQGMVKQDSSDWRPYWFLGAIANMKKDDSSAILNYNKVTKLAKWNPDGWVGVASIYFDKGDLQQALDVLDEAEKNVKEDFRVQFLSGLTLQRLKRPTDAALALERAIQINPKSVDALSALGLVYDELKRPQDSDTMYERAIRLNPKNDLVLNNYGYSLADRGIKLERALAMIKQALEAQPTNTSYLDSMGWVNFRLENYNEAAEYILKAIDLGSKSPVIFEHLGDIYSKMNQKDKAQEYWKKALELDTTNQLLKEKLERGSF